MCSQIYEISTPPWLRRLRSFALDLGVASSSPLVVVANCLKALETFINYYFRYFGIEIEFPDLRDQRNRPRGFSGAKAAFS